MYLPPRMRTRLTIAAISFVGFVIFLVAKLCLQPPSSTVLLERPQAGRKISVIVAPPTAHTQTQLNSLCAEIAQVLSQEGLEAEFLVAGLDWLTSDFQALRSNGHHVELVTQGAGFTETVTNAFDKAHFSIMLVVSDVAMPVAELVPKLVGPVVNRDSDFTLTQHPDYSLILGLLSLPLTHSLAGGYNSSDFCLHRAVWMRACQGVSPQAASLGLELLAKCSLHSHSVSLLGDTSLHHLRRDTLLLQIFALYWSTHPVWSSVAMVMLLLVIVMCAKAKLLQNRTQTSSTRVSV